MTVDRRERGGQKGTGMDRRGQAWTEGDRRGQAWTGVDRRGQAWLEQQALRGLFRLPRARVSMQQNRKLSTGFHLDTTTPSRPSVLLTPPSSSIHPSCLPVTSPSFTSLLPLHSSSSSSSLPPPPPLLSPSSPSPLLLLSPSRVC